MLLHRLILPTCQGTMKITRVYLQAAANGSIWLEAVLQRIEERCSSAVECKCLLLVSSWLHWLLTPMACSTIPRHYLLSIRFGFLISECCAWCWTNFSLFCLGCQFLTLDGHVNFPFLPQSGCLNFSEFHGNNFWRLYKSINFLYHYNEAWQMVLKEQVKFPCSWGSRL